MTATRESRQNVFRRIANRPHAEWPVYDTTLVYRRKENSEHDDHRQYSVFMTNRGSGHLTEYGYQWEIESGCKSIKRFMAANPL